MSTYQPGARLSDDEPHTDYFESGDGIPSRTVLARAELFEEDRFDERFRVREDPHLWARLLREADVECVDEALAVKRRREGSLTDDPSEVYRYELLEAADLAARDDDFAEVFERRRAAVHYNHGRRLLSNGAGRSARKHLAEAIVAGHRTGKCAALLAIACLPVGRRRAKDALDRLRGRWHE